MRNELSRVTIVYCVLLASGAAIVLPHPTWTGLAALLLFLPGIAINRVLDRPAKRGKAVKA